MPKVDRRTKRELTVVGSSPPPFASSVFVGVCVATTKLKYHLISLKSPFSNNLNSGHVMRAFALCSSFQRLRVPRPSLLPTAPPPRFHVFPVKTKYAYVRKFYAENSNSSEQNSWDCFCHYRGRSDEKSSDTGTRSWLPRANDWQPPLFSVQWLSSIQLEHVGMDR